ncbi:MAG: hypothetical protein ACI4PV_04905 [Butyricicoccus sp.]
MEKTSLKHKSSLVKIISMCAEIVKYSALFPGNFRKNCAVLHTNPPERERKTQRLPGKEKAFPFRKTF